MEGEWRGSGWHEGRGRGRGGVSIEWRGQEAKTTIYPARWRLPKCALNQERSQGLGNRVGPNKG